MSAANALLQAISARLAGDGALAALLGKEGLSDRRPARPLLPALRLGDLSSSDYSACLAPALLHRLVLEIWSEGPGRKRSLEIAERAIALLDGAALKLAGHHLVTLSHQDTVSRSEAGLFVARLTLRAVTEPAAPSA